MFGNKCLGELKYEATTSAILMAGLFISFLIEFIVHRAMRWQAGKKSELAEPSDKSVASAEMANITIMEAGIIFHSLRTYPFPFHSRFVFSFAAFFD
jgi:solute carrier family 39 (zinc transporter), member 1/2/3